MHYTEKLQQKRERQILCPLKIDCFQRQKYQRQESLILILLYLAFIIIIIELIHIMESRKKGQSKDDKTVTSDVKLRTQINDSQTFIRDDSSAANASQPEDKESTCADKISDFFGLYDFCDSREKCLIVFGVIFGLLSGTAFPVFVYVWGLQLNHLFNQFKTISQSLDKSRAYFGGMVAVGVGIFVIHGILFTIWRVISESISHKFRKRFLQSFINRRVQWIQQQNLYEVSSAFNTNVETIEHALGDKVALLINLIGLTLSGMIAAVSVRWTFTLYLIAIIPVGAIVMIIFLYVVIKKKQSSVQFYEIANSQSVEATSLIKTVKLLGGQEYQQNIYKRHLRQFHQKIKGFPKKVGITTALFYFIQYFISAMGFLYGIQCVRGTSACPPNVTGSHYSLAEVHVVFGQMFLCAYSYLQLAVNLEAIQNAITSSKFIYKFIKETDRLNEAKFQKTIEDEELDKKIKSIGEIQLKNIYFAYPINPDKNILKGISLKILKNKFNAIVGTTGSGKSTIIQLLLKYYQAQRGTITIDGVDFNQISPSWFRDKIGFVGQEPVLFNGTIRDNLRVGKPNATDEEIYQALKKSSIYDFVMQIPQRLDYNIGVGGSRLSGGQKQRIAIARALIKKPQLLILDEATSALDRKTEKVIQKTINDLFASKQSSITVICIAHRIKTIRRAHKIWYIENGIVKEEGKFQQLQCYKDIEIEEDDEEIELGEVFHNDPNEKAEDEQNSKENVDDYIGSVYGRILDYSQHKCQYFIAVLCSLLNGFNHPGASIIIAYIYYNQIQIYVLGDMMGWTGTYQGMSVQEKLDGWHDSSIRFLMGFLGLSFYCIIPYFIQFTIMSKTQDQITNNIRVDVFKKLMIMPNTWYEKPENEGGRAATRYGIETQQMSSLVSNYIPVLVSNFTTMIAGVVVSLIYTWKIGLVNVFVLPAVTFGGYISISFIGGFDDENLHIYEPSNKIADELIINIKTIFALNFQRRMLQKYKDALFQPTKEMALRGLKIGCFFGFAFFTLFVSVAISSFVCANIIAGDSNLDQQGFVFGMISSSWCGWLAGNSFFFASHAGAGKKSAKSVFKFLDTTNEAQDQERPSTKLAQSPLKIKGRIQFRNVSFKYKKGLNSKKVVDNVSFVIEAGQKAAFVGQSGCGKSTILQLLQRFYKYQGDILLDGVNILDYDLKQYRAYFAVLNQQPSLFMGTLRQNLLLDTKTSEQELIEACEMSYSYDVNRSWKGDISVKDNIKQFLERDVGPKGSKVSGGEKQRLACARSILRKPQIFLMDEGTSALDRQTQKRVQQNIDRKLKGITSVNIAHRIETIQNSDIIFLFEDGKILESGRYNEMMDRKSHFYKFVKGSKFKTMNQISELILQKLVARLLGFKK